MSMGSYVGGRENSSQDQVKESIWGVGGRWENSVVKSILWWAALCNTIFNKLNLPLT